MAKGPFEPLQFTPTEFAPAADKAAFGNMLLHFAKADFPRNLFKKPFYRRLSLTFGHIAHFDLFGFFETWFENDASKLAFVRHTLRYPCYGDPAYTFSDVERAIQIEIRAHNLETIYTIRVEQALREKELQELARLQQKYAAPIVPSLPHSPDTSSAKRVDGTPEPVSKLGFERTPVQASLF